MFFILGISSASKQLEYIQNFLCSKCGKFGKYEIYITYTYLSLFFIPILKWNKKYYAKSTCCKNTYMLNYETGEKIRKGIDITINDSDLTAVKNNGDVCHVCGAYLNTEFEYCPKCGTKIN